MDSVSVLIDAALKGVRIRSDRAYEIDKSLAEKLKDSTRQLCEKFPMR